jgi:hypothetical protein
VQLASDKDLLFSKSSPFLSLWSGPMLLPPQIPTFCFLFYFSPTFSDVVVLCYFIHRSAVSLTPWASSWVTSWREGAMFNS